MCGLRGRGHGGDFDWVNAFRFLRAKMLKQVQHDDRVGISGFTENVIREPRTETGLERREPRAKNRDGFENQESRTKNRDGLRWSWF